MLLDYTLAVAVIPVVRHVAVLTDRHQTVLLVPAELLLSGQLTLHAVTLPAPGVHVQDVAVRVVLVEVLLVDVVTVFGGTDSAVVHVSDRGHTETPAGSTVVRVGQVVARIERARELDARLADVLSLARDAVHIVVGHRQVIARLRAASGAVGLRQTVQVVIHIGVAHGKIVQQARTAVGHGQNVAHGVVAVDALHSGVRAGQRQRIKTAHLIIVGVFRLRAVAVPHVDPVAELVVADLLDVAVAVLALLHVHLRQLPATVVPVAHLLSVGVGQRQQFAEAVVLELRLERAHVLVRDCHRAHRLLHVAHVVVGVLLPAGGVKAEAQTALGVVRVVRSAVIVAHVVLGMLGILHGDQTPPVVAVLDEQGTVPEVRRLARQDVAQSVVGERRLAARRMAHPDPAVAHVVLAHRHVGVGVHHLDKAADAVVGELCHYLLGAVELDALQRAAAA